jgi:hypothetical protein
MRKWCWSSRPAPDSRCRCDRVSADLRVLSNDQVEQFNQNAFSYFRQISTVLRR